MTLLISFWNYRIWFTFRQNINNRPERNFHRNKNCFLFAVFFFFQKFNFYDENSHIEWKVFTLRHEIIYWLICAMTAEFKNALQPLRTHTHFKLTVNQMELIHFKSPKNDLRFLSGLIRIVCVWFLDCTRWTS